MIEPVLISMTPKDLLTVITVLDNQQVKDLILIKKLRQTFRSHIEHLGITPEVIEQLKEGL